MSSTTAFIIKEIFSKRPEILPKKSRLIHFWSHLVTKFALIHTHTFREKIFEFYGFECVHSR